MAERVALLTIDQAAEQCTCRPRTLRKAIKAGSLAVVVMGKGPKSWRVREPDLRAYIAAQTVTLCPSENAPKAPMKFQPLGADARCADLLGTGRSKTPAMSSGRSLRKSAPLRLVASRKG